MTRHIYAGDESIATIEADGQSTTTYYIHTDHLGGSSVVSDEDGQIVEVTDYYPFGDLRLDEKEGTFTEQRKFTGHEHDNQTDLEYMVARYYDGNVGRFTNQDTVYIGIGNRTEIEQKIGKSFEVFLADPQNLNSYSYVKNNPLKHVDVTGEYWESVVDIVSLGLSLYDFNRERSFTNGLFVGLDAVGLALPVPAVFGYVKNGAKVAKIASYFNKVANNAGDAVRLGKLFVQNVGFKFTGRAWSIGEAGNDVASLVGHYAKWGEKVGANSITSYYNKANDFIGNKQYTHAFSEGSDTVYFNQKTNHAVVTGSKGEIKSYHLESNPNKLQSYESRIKKGNYN